ncbi:MAG TPA: STAS domain-containing protein [Micromonosporaceae bacterium]
MPNFEVKTSPGESLVVSLAGECDLTTRSELAAALAEAVNESAVVVVDLTDLSFIDSSGIHELVTAYRAALDRRGALYVRNASDVVATVLEVTGIGGLLAPPTEHGLQKDQSR